MSAYEGGLTKCTQENFLEWSNILHLCWGGGQSLVYICSNLLNYNFKIYSFYVMWIIFQLNENNYFRNNMQLYSKKSILSSPKLAKIDNICIYHVCMHVYQG